MFSQLAVTPYQLTEHCADVQQTLMFSQLAVTPYQLTKHCADTAKFNVLTVSCNSIPADRTLCRCTANKVSLSVPADRHLLFLARASSDRFPILQDLAAASANQSTGQHSPKTSLDDDSSSIEVISEDNTEQSLQYPRRTGS
jgi:hypothetical protein